MKPNPLMIEALKLWGEDEQLRMLQEECAELIQAVNKYHRGKNGAELNLLEEGVDVELMLEQLKLILGSPLTWEQKREEKLTRLKIHLERAV